jgi:hypothetical protein
LKAFRTTHREHHEVNKTGLTGFGMAEVSADKAHQGGENLLTTVRHGALSFLGQVLSDNHRDFHVLV